MKLNPQPTFTLAAASRLALATTNALEAPRVIHGVVEGGWFVRPTLVRLEQVPLRQWPGDAQAHPGVSSSEIVGLYVAHPERVVPRLELVNGEIPEPIPDPESDREVDLFAVLALASGMSVAIRHGLSVRALAALAVQQRFTLTDAALRQFAGMMDSIAEELERGTTGGRIAPKDRFFGRGVATAPSGPEPAP